MAHDTKDEAGTRAERSGLLADSGNGSGNGHANGTGDSAGGGGDDNDVEENQCFVECMNRYVAFVQPHYKVMLAVLGGFFVCWAVAYGWSLKVYAENRKIELNCERPLLKWLLFDAIVGLLFWVFAGALMAVLPVTFRHLRPVGHLTPRGITRRGVKEEEFHDSFFGLYCLWLLWVICFIILLTMKVVASLYLYHDMSRTDHFCLPPIYDWAWWLVTVSWGVQGAGVLAFVGVMVYPVIRERMAGRPLYGTESVGGRDVTEDGAAARP